MSELSPCPFCGGTDSADNAVQQAKVSMHSFRSAVSTEAWRVACGCGVSGRGFDGRDGMAKAAAFWNRRTPSDLTKGAGT